MAELEWTMLVSCATGFEADMLVAQLEEAGIPAWARSDSIGIFGPGFMGAPPQGVGVMVPSDAVDAAREIVDTE